MCSGCTSPRSTKALAASLIKSNGARNCGAGSGGRRRHNCCRRAAGVTCSEMDAGGVGGADRQRDQGHRRQCRNHHCASSCPRRTARLRADATRRRTGGEHYYPGMDLAVRHGFWRGHRHRRSAQPQFDRGPRVRHSRCAGYCSGDPVDSQRPADHRRRRRRRRQAARRPRALEN